MTYSALTHTFSHKQAGNGFFTIALQFTRTCNYRCSHCSESSPLESLPTKQVYKIIDNLAHAGIKRVNISGGEPTLREDWLDLIDYISQKKLYSSLATNCSTITPQTLQALRGKISNLRVSIYGNERTHEAITTVPGSFQRTRETAKKSQEIGIPTYACMTVMQDNLEQIAEVRNICREVGMEKLLLYSLVPKGRGSEI